MSKPNRLLYPTVLIDRQVTKLQRDLRRLLRAYRKGTLNRLQCQVQGEAAINTAYTAIQCDIKTYLQKRGLLFMGDFTVLEQRLMETLTRWRKITDDFN